MFKKIMLYIIFCVVTLPMTAQAQSLSKTHFITENLPPFNYVEDNILKGSSVEILKAALTAVNINTSSTKIDVYPWARGYKTLLKQPNTCLLSTVQTDKRKELFKWVGPITHVNLVFISQNKDIEINKLEDVKKYSVTTVREAIGHQRLMQEGFAENLIDLSADISTMIEKIKRHRIDLLLENENVIFHTLKMKNMDSKGFIKHYTLDFRPLYFAFSKTTENYVVAKLQEGMDIIRKNGTLDRILRKMPAAPQ